MERPVGAVPSLTVRPVLAPPDLPGGEPIVPKLFLGSFIFPYVALAGGGTVPPPCPAGEVEVDGRCRHHKRIKKHVVSEPSTVMLAGAGLLLIVWRYRRAALALPT